jgi:hypothetical protein
MTVANKRLFSASRYIDRRPLNRVGGGTRVCCKRFWRSALELGWQGSVDYTLPMLYHFRSMYLERRDNKAISTSERGTFSSRFPPPSPLPSHIHATWANNQQSRKDSMSQQHAGATYGPSAVEPSTTYVPMIKVALVGDGAVGKVSPSPQPLLFGSLRSSYNKFEQGI